LSLIGIYYRYITEAPVEGAYLSITGLIGIYCRYITEAPVEAGTTQ